MSWSFYKNISVNSLKNIKENMVKKFVKKSVKKSVKKFVKTCGEQIKSIYKKKL